MLGSDVGYTDGEPEREGFFVPDGDALSNSLGSMGQYSFDGSKLITCLLAQFMSSV